MHEERVTDALHYAEKHYGDRLAYLEPERTYREFADECRRLASYLEAQGVGHGDRVATLMPNSMLTLQLNFAVPGIGAVIVPLNTRLALPELREIVEDCGPTVLIVGPEFDALGKGVVDLVPVLARVDEIDLSVHRSRELGTEEVRQDDVAAIFYTGGTTGRSKGVTLTHHNLVTVSLRAGWFMRFDPDDVLLLSIPMYHAAGTVYSMPIVWAGGAHVSIRRFEPVDVLEAIQKYRVTFQCYLATILQMLVDHPDFGKYDTSSMRKIVQGGATPALMSRAMKAMPQVSFRSAYGMTESGGNLTMLIDQQQMVGKPVFASVGRPPPGTLMEIRRPDGTVADVGEAGEIVASGGNITRGYWNQPELSAQVLRDGWYWTGDQGYVDAEGNFYMVDRITDMIKSGGENVYSAEVERALASHPAVREIAVVGMPDEKWGERVHAVIVLRDGMSAHGDDFVAFCREKIAGYKIPRSYEFVDALPKNEVGKVLKRAIRERNVERASSISNSSR